MTAREDGPAEAPAEIGPALLFSLLIITLRFVPIHTGRHLHAQEGRLSQPLAFTKTYAMAAAIPPVTLIPVGQDP